jgi:hypothetical protein
MAFFYAPPPPSQGSASYAPPIPHEPPPTRGDEPPRRQVQAALAMAVVLASWPSDLEPRLQPPNNTRVKIAPLTLTYGDQPPISGPITPSEYAQIRLAWPTDWAAQSGPHVAPLVPPPVIGDNPPFPGAITPTEVLIGQAWPRDWGEPQRLPTVVQAGIASVPTPVGPLASPVLSTILTAWTAGWPAQSAPANAGWNTNVPLDTFIPHSPVPVAVLMAWHDPLEIELVTTWTIAPDNPDQPPIAGPVSASEYAQLQRAWPTEWGTQRLPTLVQPGTAPPPITGPITVPELTLFRSWPTDWTAQTGAKCAAWFVPPPVNNPPFPGQTTPTAILIGQSWPRDWTAQARPVVVVPPTPGAAPAPRASSSHQHLWTWWEPPPPLPVRPVSIVVVTIPTGQPPPPIRSLSNANLGALVNQWVLQWPAQAVKPQQTVDNTAPPPVFKPEWAVNANQFFGPLGRESITH